MRLHAFWSLVTTISLASATALTYKVAAHEKACFFTDATSKNSKIAFYFAVCLVARLAASRLFHRRVDPTTRRLPWCPGRADDL
jgi:hypothetical protein